jgi:hypothetical protein
LSRGLSPPSCLTCSAHKKSARIIGRAAVPTKPCRRVQVRFVVQEVWRSNYKQNVQVYLSCCRVLKTAPDPARDILYLFDEYYGEAHVPTHAAALRPHGDWMTGLIDPTAHGRDQMDGFRLMEILMNHSVRLEAISDPVEAGNS